MDQMDKMVDCAIIQFEGNVCGRCAAARCHMRQMGAWLELDLFCFVLFFANLQAVGAGEKRSSLESCRRDASSHF